MFGGICSKRNKNIFGIISRTNVPLRISNSVSIESHSAFFKSFTTSCNWSIFLSAFFKSFITSCNWSIFLSISLSFIMRAVRGSMHTIVYRKLCDASVPQKCVCVCCSIVVLSTRKIKDEVYRCCGRNVQHSSHR